MRKQMMRMKIIFSDKIGDISKNFKLTLSDIALTEPQAQAVSFVANKSDNNSLSQFLNVWIVRDYSMINKFYITTSILTMKV